MIVTQQQLTKVITSHAWGPLHTQLAICPNNNEVHIYSATQGDSAWPKLDTLSGHDHVITSMDWSHVHGQLVTCSQDRSAIVWHRTGESCQWTRQRVVMRVRLAALCVQWSPDGSKFAVGSSDMSLSVCYFEQQHSWWACKSLAKGKHTSSVVALAWHPSSHLLATACTDCSCRIVNAALPGGTDIGSGAAGICTASRCGDVLLDVPSDSGWCTSLAWAPSGTRLAFTSHNLYVTVISGIDLHISALGSFREAASLHRIMMIDHSPMRAIGYLSDDQIVAGGFDGQPVLLQAHQQTWSSALLKTDRSRSEMQLHSTPTKLLAKDFSSKLAMFSSPSPTKASMKQEERSTAPLNAHANAIVELSVILDAQGGPTQRFSTAAWDGRVVVWDLSQSAERIGAVHA